MHLLRGHTGVSTVFGWESAHYMQKFEVFVQNNQKGNDWLITNEYLVRRVAVVDVLGVNQDLFMKKVVLMINSEINDLIITSWL